MASPALLALFLALASPGVQSDAVAVAKRLGKDYEKALANRDLQWFQNRTTWNFVNVTLEGQKQTRSVALSTLKYDFNTIQKLEKVKVEVLSAKYLSSGLLATTPQALSVKYRISISGKYKNVKGRIESTQQEEDVWMFNRNTWALRQTVTKSVVTKLNGKVVR